MSLQSTLNELSKLSMQEKLILLEKVWSDLSEAPAQIPVPEWHKKELDTRLADHQQNSDALITWDEVKAGIKYHRE